jgi:predicted transcriptional regulator
MVVTIYIAWQTPSFSVAFAANSIEYVSKSAVRTRVLALLSGATRTPTEIAKLENRHVSHVCRTIKELEAQGLVEVAWSEPRRRYYRTTRSGYSLGLTLSQRMK